MSKVVDLSKYKLDKKRKTRENANREVQEYIRNEATDIERMLTDLLKWENLDE